MTTCCWCQAHRRCLAPPGKHEHPPIPRDHPGHPHRQRQYGYGHRGADGRGHGPPGRHRHHPSLYVLEQQVRQVPQVKRAQGAMVEQPSTVSPSRPWPRRAS